MSQLDYDEDGNLLYNGNVYYRADDRFEARTIKLLSLVGNLCFL